MIVDDKNSIVFSFPQILPPKTFQTTSISWNYTSNFRPLNRNHESKSLFKHFPVKSRLKSLFRDLRTICKICLWLPFIHADSHRSTKRPTCFTLLHQTFVALSVQNSSRPRNTTVFRPGFTQSTWVIWRWGKFSVLRWIKTRKLSSNITTKFHYSRRLFKSFTIPFLSLYHFRTFFTQFDSERSNSTLLLSRPGSRKMSTERNARFVI